MVTKKIGIDLGTCNSWVFVPKKGIVFGEPSVVAISKPEKKILAVGTEAKVMIGRTPDNIVVYRPLKDGVIADYQVTKAMLKYFISKTLGYFKFIKPDVVISTPAGSTSTEQRAIIEAAISSGAKNCYLVKEPILAAIGAGIPIYSFQGNMIVNIGGGTTEIAVISLGGIVAWSSIRVAGDKMDLAIKDYVKKQYNLAIGIQTAEEIKIKIGQAIFQKKEETMTVRGRDLISGLPKDIRISSNEVAGAIKDVLGQIIFAIKNVLRETPPELSADIMNKGIIISGGSSLLRNLDILISKEIGVPCFVADEPLYCVIKGIGIVLDNLELYKKSLTSKNV
ncbi:MAG: rod shape-determining protein [Minisyncoccia bacterium]